MPELFAQADIDDLFDGLGGRAGSYTPYGGAAVDVTVLLDPGSIQVTDDGGRIVAQHDAVTFNRGEVDEPAKDGILVITGVGTWRMVEIEERDDATYVMRAVQTA